MHSLIPNRAQHPLACALLHHVSWSVSWRHVVLGMQPHSDLLKVASSQLRRCPIAHKVQVVGQEAPPASSSQPDLRGKI
eukprot:189838-Chlamydomonas_euryale.AAC.12